MSEDRTQAPTRRRRQEARERGQVARSGDLTAAAGWLAAVVLLGMLGEGLARGLGDLLRGPLEAARVGVGTSPEFLVEQVRGAAWGVFGPLLGIVLGVWATMIAVHQVQVGGLWAPGLLAPEPARLLGGLNGIGHGAGRGAWALVRVGVLAAVAAGLLRSEWGALEALSGAEPGAMVEGSAAIVLRLGRGLALVLVGLGAVDFALCWRRVEESLRQTPDEYREDLKAADGDPALRSRRRRLTQVWRRDGGEVLPGAGALLVGVNGVAVLLGGGPPPERLTVRRVARGAAAGLLRREAAAAGVPLIVAPVSARHLARGRAGGASLPAAVAAELAAAWPKNPGKPPV